MAKLSAGSIIFVNPTKRKRAEDLYIIVSGAKLPKSEGEVYDKTRYTELLQEEKVNLKDKEATVLAIYKIMGGAVLTQGEVAEQKELQKRKKLAEKDLKEEEDGKDADDDEDEDDDA